MARLAAVRRSAGALACSYDDFLFGERGFGVVAQAHRGTGLHEAGALGSYVELACPQPSDVRYVTPLGSWHLPSRVDLSGTAQQAVELRGRVAGDAIVQRLRCLRREQQP